MFAVKMRCGLDNWIRVSRKFETYIEAHKALISIQTTKMINSEHLQVVETKGRIK